MYALRTAVILLFLGVLAPAAHAERWQPSPGTTWQWQLSGTVDSRFDVAMYDIDGFETTAATVAALHDRGSFATCYISAGSWENWRPDRARFPQRVRGKALDGWPDERWLDIRRLDLIGGPLKKRLQMCANKGFDAVEPDNINAWQENTGFAITRAQQLRFNRWLAREAHALGLSIALKNDGPQAATLAPLYDFAIVEQCIQYRECSDYQPFISLGKAVFVAEYQSLSAYQCGAAAQQQLSVIRKRLNLDAWLRTCP